MTERRPMPNASELIDLLAAPAGDPRPMPRTVVLAAHPDDEVIGLGCRLPRLRGAAVFAHVTDGSPRNDRDARINGFDTREEYAAVRRKELICALSLAGVGEADTRQFGFVDQEVPHRLTEVTRKVFDLLRDVRPRLLVTHPYEGGHPDHESTAFAAHAACRLLQQAGEDSPALVEMTSYHNSPGGIETGVFLPAAGCQETALVLAEAEQAFKHRLLDCFNTQRRMLQSFGTDVERFRPAPRYDFTRPPHEGKLYYEQFDWGMTGERFRSLAADALRELGLAAATEA